jgi:hypothetical protein
MRLRATRPFLTATSLHRDGPNLASLGRGHKSRVAGNATERKTGQAFAHHLPANWHGDAGKLSFRAGLWNDTRQRPMCDGEGNKAFFMFSKGDNK